MALTAQTIKFIRSLHTPKGRSEHKLFLAEGIRTVTAFIEAGFTHQGLYICSTKPALMSQLPPSLSYQPIPERQMETISTSSTPSGILALFHIPHPPELSTLGEGLVLANVMDPGNVGTLIRSAASFGYKTVVVIEGCDPYSPKVVQATAGALATVNLFQLSWDQLIKHKRNLSLCALVAREGKRPQELTLTNTLLVVGNEAHGIPETWIAQCDTRLTLPMKGTTESLNAAIAGSIALFLASQD